MRGDNVYFSSGEMMLEGLYAPSPGVRGAVIAHPHPLMGGSMRDNVVMALVAIFQLKGFSTLRFNFRGVGRSEGIFDGGDGEVDDLGAAVSFLLGEGVKEIHLGGYSFGALIAAKYLSRDVLIGHTILVSPPLSESSLDLSGLVGTRGTMICGENDIFCPAPEMEMAARAASWDSVVIKGADHFYLGRESELMTVIGERLPCGSESCPAVRS